MQSKLSIEPDGDEEEEEDEQLLKGNAAHVYVNAEEDLMGWLMLAGGRSSAESLNREGDDVKENEVETEAPRFDAKDFSGSGEVIDHAAHDHVDEGVGPDGCNL